MSVSSWRMSIATMSRFLSSKRETIAPTSLRSTASGLSRTKVRSDMAAQAIGSVWSVGEVSQHLAGGAGDVDAACCQDGVVGIGVAHRRRARLFHRLVHVDLRATQLTRGLADVDGRDASWGRCRADADDVELVGS